VNLFKTKYYKTVKSTNLLKLFKLFNLSYTSRHSRSKFNNFKNTDPALKNSRIPIKTGLLACIIILAGSLLTLSLYKTAEQHSDEMQSENIQLPVPQNEYANTQTPHSTLEWKSLTVNPGDSLNSILGRAGISTHEIQALLSIKSSNLYLKKVHPGQSIKIQVDQHNHLLAYTQTIHQDQLLNIRNISKSGDTPNYQASIEAIPFETRVTYGHATISDSLFVSGIRAGMDDSLIMKLAEIFAYDIDFALDIRPGDHFSMLYEEKYLEGKKISNGPIIAAEFHTQGRSYQAIRYVDQFGKADYFSPSGKGLHKAFIRTPVNYTRISSHFNLKRHHPILHKIRAHRGVDYAAPRGTPVKSVGDGKITFLGTKGGYGHTVIIEHGKKQGKYYTTLYAHLSRFANTLRVGHRVKQGQVIAYVGSSGLATAPHLHYEFHVDGIHRNPLTVALPKSDGVQGLQTPKFLEHARNVLTLMAYHEKVSSKNAFVYNEY